MISTAVPAGGAATPSVVAQPMRVGAALPGSVMTAGSSDHGAQMAARARATAGTRVVQSLSWNYIPAAASQIAYALDGTLYALAAGAAGTDKTIWRYTPGGWQNIPGAAIRIAPGGNDPAGIATLWAITSAGTLYWFNGTSWTAIGGAAQDVTLGYDGNVYLIAKGGADDNQVWQYAPTTGRFAYAGGAAAHLVGLPDAALYAVTRSGALYAGTTAFGGTYGGCQGAVLDVAPIGGGAGFFAIGATAQPADGAGLYRWTPQSSGDCSRGGYTLLDGFGTAVATSSTQLAVLGTDGAVYTTALPAPLSSALTGYVVSADTGAPVGGATVAVGTTFASAGQSVGGPSATLGGIAASARTAGDGSFTLASVPSGTPYIQITAPGYATSHRHLVATTGPIPAIPLVVPTTDEQAALVQVNADRAKYGSGAGQSPLTFDSDLLLVGRERATQMAAGGWYSHTLPGTRFGANNILICAVGGGSFCSPPFPFLPGENADNNYPGATLVTAEAAYIAEGPSGGHYQATINPLNIWVGFGEAAGFPNSQSYPGATAYFATEYMISQ